MQLKAMPNKVIVRKASKKNNSSSNLLYLMPDVSDSLGIVFLVGDSVEGIKPGDRIYHGPHVEPLRIKGEDVLVMESDNVYIIAEKREVLDEEKTV